SAVHRKSPRSFVSRAPASSRRFARSSDGEASPNETRAGSEQPTSCGGSMLTELRIRNFAIIESLTLPLGPGFNVLSGETGAGKSIIVGALALLLGERGGADLVRTWSDKATVEGVFDVADRAELRALLDDRGIDADESLVVL